MSAEGQIFVEKRSPYKGSTYDVHLRLGLLSNDAHDYRIWSGDEYLADKCRCSIRTVRRAKAQLVKDGYLRQVFPGAGRQVAEYQFIFKGQEIGGQPVTLKRIGGQPRLNRRTTGPTTPTNTNELKESENPSISDPGELEKLRANIQRIRGTLAPGLQRIK